MTKPDWKKMTKTLCDLHEEHGAAVVDSEGEMIVEDGGLVDRTGGEDLMRMEGRALTPKAVRRWLWENRKAPWTGGENTVLWSLYDEESDASLVGIAEAPHG